MKTPELKEEIKNLKLNSKEIYKRQAAKRKAFLEDPENAQAISSAKLSISIARDLYQSRNGKG